MPSWDVNVNLMQQEVQQEKVVLDKDWRRFLRVASSERVLMVGEMLIVSVFARDCVMGQWVLWAQHSAARLL
jgi:hypothetical protein